MTTKLPQELVKAFRNGRGAVFLGSGASCAAGLPSWSELVTKFAKDLEISLERYNDQYPVSLLLAIPQYYMNKNSRRDLIRSLQEKMSNVHKNAPIHKLVAQLPTNTFYTTNFDTLLEDELSDQRKDFHLIKDEYSARYYTERVECQIRKIHGCIKDPNTMILTRSDYATFLENRKLIVQSLQQDLASMVFLFVGYSLRDPDFNAIYDQIFYRMKGDHQNHFVCLEKPSQYEVDDLKLQGLSVIDISNWHGSTISLRTTSFFNIACGGNIRCYSS